jgi:phage/plasmid-associated DNA primase
MRIELKGLFLSAALAALILPVAAQNNTTPTPEPPSPTQNKPTTIRQRDRNQQERIANGVKSGELTSREAGHIEGQENKLNNEVKDMRQDNGGKLTAADKAKVQGQENHLSREIYNQKHDAQTQNTDPKTVAGQRAENQQDRIANGVRSGQLTPGEASRLENQQSRMRNEARNMRQENGGTLSQQDRERLHHQQRVESHRIYRAKHNGRHRN